MSARKIPIFERKDKQKMNQIITNARDDLKKPKVAASEIIVLQPNPTK